MERQKETSEHGGVLTFHLDYDISPGVGENET